MGARTSKEGSGGATNAGIGVVCRIQRGFSILGAERERLEFAGERIRRSMLDGEIGGKEEEGDEGGGGGEYPFSFSKCFRMGCEGERSRIKVVLITKEGVFRGAKRHTHGGGRLGWCGWKMKEGRGIIAAGRVLACMGWRLHQGRASQVFFSQNASQFFNNFGFY